MAEGDTVYHYRTHRIPHYDNDLVMREINEIIIHCSATPEGRNYTVEDIDRWHKARGWKGIGYHFVIYLDGSVHKGRPVSQVGAHCKGHNAHSIGVCYIGGSRRSSSGKLISADTRTPAQKQALRDIVAELHQQFPKAQILGHRDLSPDLNHDGKITRNEWITDCPSFDVKSEWPHPSQTYPSMAGTSQGVMT